ncbi:MULTISPECIES: ArsR/SmtB family transcription factor [Agrobacterium]|jgi:DNA-binding transcriptional ArsR family regulator|uniref:ArsR/SmtB family transcription factor n=1 Tax=Agrobacterium TaxID=357 RepID=UPI001FA95EE5|nr:MULTISPECIES: metalloregulator ArsR/SmtB family transcription factor [Agrobacterium]MCZ7889472.1 metalloregulator ArsR/SmtB family transcription factor [Agrobacterium salinitolerans]UNZ54021.1 metalloregulator ArsR/SmtB family transcription factor [Agrobacterium tumefaciens]
MGTPKVNYDAAAALISAMSNPVRLQTLLRLAEAEMSVNAISESLGLSQSAVSQHLKKLRDLNLVETRRDSQTIFYSVPHESPALKIIDVLRELDLWRRRID